MTSHPDFKQDTDADVVAHSFQQFIKGRIVLITGVGPDGIGRTTALSIASQNPSLLILSGRSKDKLKAVETEIRCAHPSVSLRLLVVDLSSQKSVRAAAQEVNAYPEPTLDILINNAGVMAIPNRTLSEDGIEMQLATNHIGHFLFTNLILGKIKAAAQKNAAHATRIINVSSSAQGLASFRFSDWNFEGKTLTEEEKNSVKWPVLKALGAQEDPTQAYNAWTAYAQSKSANVLFTVYLAQRLAQFGIVALSLHPGSIKSSLARHMDAEGSAKLQAAVAHVFQKTQEQGASTTLVAAFDPKLDAKDGHVFLADCQLQNAASWSVDAEKAGKLWKISEEIVSQKFEI